MAICLRAFRWRVIAVVSAIALLVGVLEGFAAPGASALTLAAARPVAVRPSVAAADAGMSTRGAAALLASSAARKSGRRVEIMADRTALSQTFANPLGTYTSVVSATPRWVERGSSWVAADATLTRGQDGTWVPKAAESGLAFSNGGGRVLATVTSGSQWLSVAWPTALPAPVVAGASATYRDVLPGVDLVATAGVTGGFTETLVIRDKAAAADPGLRDLTLGLAMSKGLRQHAGEDGSVVVETAQGKPLFSSPAPVAWDSRSTAAAASSVAGPGHGARVASVGASYSAGSVRLSVPVALLSGPPASFPVYVDPSYSESPWWQGYGEIQSAYPTAAELNDTFNGNVSVGYDGGGIDRGEYVFGLPSAADSSAVTIQSATLTGTAVTTYSSSSVSHTINAYDVSQYTSTSTWDNPPSHLAGPSAQTFTTTSTAPNQNVSWNVASWLQTAYNGNAFQMSVELDNSDEADSGPFVEFGPSPTVTYTYSQPAPTIPVGSGPAPNATFRSFPISDKVSLQVNVGSGDALLTTSDISIPEMGTNLTLGTSYNSLLTTSSVAQGSNGYGWRQAEGVDVRLYLGSGSSGSVTFLGQDGTAGVFTAPTSGNTYGSPPVFHVTLSSAPTSTCSGSTYQMTWHATGEVMCFNADGLLTSETDRDGNTTAYSYNGEGQETSVTYTPKGNSSPLYTVAASYTGNYLTGLSESGGSAGTKNITYSVNSSGDLTSIAQADGTTILLGYDSSHDLTSVKNGAGVTTTLGYNSSHQVTSVTQPYSSCGCTGTTRLSYVSSTETQEADPNTNQSDAVSAVPNTTYTINSQDLVTKAVDPAGDTRSASYNSVNDITSAANGLSGGTTNNTFTNGGESVTASESPTGATSSLAYSNANSGANPTAEYQPSSEKDAQGNVTAFTYNGAGNELTAASALPATSKVTYNADGTPATSTDPDTGETTYSYNSSHQLTTITPPTSGSLKPTTITYDGFGRVATATDGDGNTVTYTYDLSDRIVKAAYTGGSHTLTVTYAYDGAGNLKTQTDPSGTTSYTYNGLNQVLSKTATSGGGTLTYTYDADGNMTSAKDAGGTTAYSYNDLNQLTSLTDETGMLWEFAYNQAGERTTTWFNTNSSESSWAGKITTTYDASGRLTRIQAYNDETPSNVVSDTSYCYNTAISGTTCGSSTADDTSLVQYSVNNQTSTVSQYSYDDSNRLTKVTNDNGTTYSYGYDNDGDVTSGAGTGSLTYNNSNQITTSGYAYDGVGDLTSDPSNGTLTYNDAGQLISASNAGGSGNGGGSESFAYAGANQDEPLSDGSATSIAYGLAGQDGQPSVDSYSTGGGTDYIIRDQQGDPLGMVRGGDSYMFVTDNLGSVTGIVEYCGCTAATYGYSPYGVLASKGAALGGNLVNENLIGYTGSLTDDMTAGSTGYVHDGNRWYDSATGAFTSEDANSYLASPSDGNRYAYAADNPANYVDPSGASLVDDLEDAGAVGAGVAALIVGGACIAGGVATGIAGAVVGPEGVVLGAVAGCAVAGAAAVTPSLIVGGLAGTADFLYDIL